MRRAGEDTGGVRTALPAGEARRYEESWGGYRWSPDMVWWCGGSDNDSNNSSSNNSNNYNNDNNDDDDDDSNNNENDTHDDQ